MIKLAPGLLKRMHCFIPRDLKSYRLLIITDKKVKSFYGDDLKVLLESKGYDVQLIAFPAGEKYKTRETKAKIESSMIKNGYTRQTCIIALGGGVVGDMAGFIAATYMRGVPYIQVPTTLLAMLDSSIGGKTAVNTPEGKNLIGAFYEPDAVIADTDCLDSLSDKQWINGWIEALKIFMTCNAAAFKKASHMKGPTLALIKRAIQIKADIVAQDPLEAGLRAVLNFGHTVGHALEKACDYKLLHGYAVGYGILVEATISLQRGYISIKEHDSVVTALHQLGIRGAYLKRFDINTILKLIKRDKKIKDNRVRCILLQGLGACCIENINDEDVRQAFKAVTAGVYYAGE